MNLRIKIINLNKQFKVGLILTHQGKNRNLEIVLHIFHLNNVKIQTGAVETIHSPPKLSNLTQTITEESTHNILEMPAEETLVLYWL